MMLGCYGARQIMRRQDGARGQLLHHGEVNFQGGQSPKEAMEVEVMAMFVKDGYYSMKNY